MTRSAPSSYDNDFFAWTQSQANGLRRLPDVARLLDVARLDIAKLAEEIEDLGKRDLREVASLLARLIEHLIKIETGAASQGLAHRSAEAIHSQASAAAAYSPSMRRLLEIDKIWRTGSRAAARYSREVGASMSPPTECPFALDELLAEPFDMDAALARLAAA